MSTKVVIFGQYGSGIMIDPKNLVLDIGPDGFPKQRVKFINETIPNAAGEDVLVNLTERLLFRRSSYHVPDGTEVSPPYASGLISGHYRYTVSRSDLGSDMGDIEIRSVP